MGLNSMFFFFKTSYHTKIKEPNLPYYLPIAGRSIIRYIFFPKVLVLWEIQQSSFRIWTQVIKSISYDNNHFATSASSIPTYNYIHRVTNIWLYSLSNQREKKHELERPSLKPLSLVSASEAEKIQKEENKLYLKVWHTEIVFINKQTLWSTKTAVTASILSIINENCE